MTEIGKNELWLAGQGHELNGEYPIPSPEELQDHWQQYLGQGNVVAAPGVYGAIRLPSQRPTAYASVDLCEVVRKTGEATQRVERQPVDEGEICLYGVGMAIQHDVLPVVQVLMNHGLVPPTEDIDAIAAIMQSWRASGVYVFANTSTLPGCELSTIEFLSQYLPGALDGMLLPRNHDGALPLTKGMLRATCSRHSVRESTPCAIL